MKTLLSTMYLFAGLAILGVAQESPGGSDSSDGSAKRINPALFYWQAAAVLPALSDSQASLIREVATGKTAYRAEDLQGLDFGATAAFLQTAAASETPCDWGIVLDVEVQLPHLAKMRELVTVTLVLAEAEIAGGEIEEGIDLLLIAHKLARDAGAGDLLIGNLTQHALERWSIQSAARHCLAWNDAQRGRYADRLEHLPPLHPLHSAFANELVWVDWFERRITEDPAAAGELLGQLGADGVEGAGGRPPGFVGKMVAEYRRMHADAQAALALRGEERKTAVAELKKETESTKNLLVAVLMPDLVNLVRAEERTFAARAMLGAALEHGPEIDAEKIAGEPFELIREDGQLQLTSGKTGETLPLGKEGK